MGDINLQLWYTFRIARKKSEFSFYSRQLRLYFTQFCL